MLYDGGGHCGSDTLVIEMSNRVKYPRAIWFALSQLLYGRWTLLALWMITQIFVGEFCELFSTSRSHSACTSYDEYTQIIDYFHIHEHDTTRTENLAHFSTRRDRARLTNTYDTEITFTLQKKNRAHVYCNTYMGKEDTNTLLELYLWICINICIFLHSAKLHSVWHCFEGLLLLLLVKCGWWLCGVVVLLTSSRLCCGFAHTHHIKNRTSHMVYPHLYRKLSIAHTKWKTLNVYERSCGSKCWWLFFTSDRRDVWFLLFMFLYILNTKYAADDERMDAWCIVSVCAKTKKNIHKPAETQTLALTLIHAIP